MSTTADCSKCTKPRVRWNGVPSERAQRPELHPRWATLSSDDGEMAAALLGVMTPGKWYARWRAPWCRDLCGLSYRVGRRGLIVARYKRRGKALTDLIGLPCEPGTSNTMLRALHSIGAVCYKRRLWAVDPKKYPYGTKVSA